MIESRNPHAVVAALRQALPYLRLYRGRTFVVKIGGEIFDHEAALRHFFEQIGVLHHLGVQCVLVHGGGPQIDRHAAALGLVSRRVAGRRVTDAALLTCAVQILAGELNTRCVAQCRALGVPAVGLSGASAGLVVARRRPPVEVDGERVDYGEVGDLEHIDPTVLRVQLAAGLVPIVAPVAADAAGRLLNCNADGVAAAIAVSLGADKLLVVTGVAGILEDLEDPASLITVLDLAGVAELRAAGVLEGGMLPKVAAIETALRGGIARVHVISWRVSDALLGEIFTNEGTGTLVVEQRSPLVTGALAGTPAEAPVAGPSTTPVRSPSTVSTPGLGA